MSQIQKENYSQYNEMKLMFLRSIQRSMNYTQREARLLTTYYNKLTITKSFFNVVQFVDFDIFILVIARLNAKYFRLDDAY